MTQEELDTLMEAEAKSSTAQDEEQNQGSDSLEDNDLLEEVLLDETKKQEESTQESQELEALCETEDVETLLESTDMTEEGGEEAASDQLEELDEKLSQESEVVENISEEAEIDEENYRADANIQWPPPPPTDDHKVVNQLDDVARDSEIKAGEIFDKLENITNVVLNIEHSATEQKEIIEKNIEVFQKLHDKFPSVTIFAEMIELNQKANDRIDEIIQNSGEISGDVMTAMDVMQYQDIHRQKIERVINVMRTLAHYMHSLFDSPIDDSKRVASAVSIASDNMMSNDEIEALLESLGK